MCGFQVNVLFISEGRVGPDNWKCGFHIIFNFEVIYVK